MEGRIYIHRNKINGKCYVGQTTLDPKMRWMNGEGYNRQAKFYNAILKHGWDNFEHLVLSDIYDNQEELNAAEIATIAKYDSFNNGYNATLGGDGGAGMTGKNHTEEAKRKISEAGKGRTPWNKDLIGPYKLSEETKNKISESNLGKHSMPKSAEWRRKIGIAFKGSKHTQEWKDKMHGRTPWNKGKLLSEAGRKRMCKNVLVIDTFDNTQKVYQRIDDFANEVKLSPTYCTVRKKQAKLIKNRFLIKDLGRNYETNTNS